MRQVAGRIVGRLVRVRISEATNKLLRRVKAESGRPFTAIVNAAAKNYLEDPEYYKPLLKIGKMPIVISVRLSRGTSDFFIDEAFVAPFGERKQLLGLIVGIFLRRYPFGNLVEVLHSYADILGPMIRGKTHGKYTETQNSKDHQTGRPGL